MRILVVEDEERLAGNIAAAMREGPGWAVDLAHSGLAGRDLCLQTEYDLVLLDLMLPGLDGLGVLRDMRGKGIATPVLVLTAVAEKASVIERSRQSPHPPRQGRQPSSHQHRCARARYRGEVRNLPRNSH